MFWGLLDRGPRPRTQWLLLVDSVKPGATHAGTPATVKYRSGAAERHTMRPGYTPWGGVGGGDGCLLIDSDRKWRALAEVPRPELAQDELPELERQHGQASHGLLVLRPCGLVAPSVCDARDCEHGCAGRHRAVAAVTDLGRGPHERGGPGPCVVARGEACRHEPRTRPDYRHRSTREATRRSSPSDLGSDHLRETLVGVMRTKDALEKEVGDIRAMIRNLGGFIHRAAIRCVRAHGGLPWNRRKQPG